MSDPLIAQADPKKIDEILLADPETLKDEEIDVLIEHYRSLRLQWVEADKIAKATGKRAKAPRTVAQTELKADLDDLLPPEGAK